MPLPVLYHEACLAHDTPEGTEHVERPDRLRAARRGLEGWSGSVLWQEPQPAKRAHLTDVHTPEHVRRVEQACDRGTWLDGDTYAIPESWDAGLLSAGAAMQAAELAADGQPAFAVTRPPGHHATGKRAMGFCLFNNVAVAAYRLTQLGCQVAVVDVDVHHGNGTQDLFYAEEDVLYASIHQSPFYPGTGMAHETGQGPGAGTTVNLPVPAGTGHEGWLELIDRVIVPVLAAFEPDVVLVSAGFDAHHLDPLGGLELVAPTFHEAIARMREVQPRIAAVLEGGYSLEALEACVPATAAALAGEPCPVDEEIPQGLKPWRMLESPVREYHGERWGVGSAT